MMIVIRKKEWIAESSIEEEDTGETTCPIKI
jgi:hypothetical protein